MSARSAHLPTTFLPFLKSRLGNLTAPFPPWGNIPRSGWIYYPGPGANRAKCAVFMAKRRFGAARSWWTATEDRLVAGRFFREFHIARGLRHLSRNKRGMHLEFRTVYPQGPFPQVSLVAERFCENTHRARHCAEDERGDFFVSYAYNQRLCLCLGCGMRLGQQKFTTTRPPDT